MNYIILIIIFSVLIFIYNKSLILDTFEDSIEVINGKGSDYRGIQNKTKSGRICQNWDSQFPHKHTRTPEKFPDSDLKDNYCRNPDGETNIWCYTTDSKKRWEYCDPKDNDNNYKIEYRTDYLNNNIGDCDKYESLEEIKKACLDDKECLGFSIKDDKPHCLKKKLGDKLAEENYNFYVKDPNLLKEPEEMIPLPSSIKLNGKLHNNILKLLWLPPSKGIKTLKYYVIVIIKQDKSSVDTEWEPPKFIFPENNICKLCEHEFNNLEYDTKYKFLLLSVNSKGVSETSNVIEIEPKNQMKQISKPKEKPPNIKNINCKADGTYTIDNQCYKDVRIDSNYDNLSHNLLINRLSRNNKDMDFDFKVI